jgi:hypothetical protein
MAMKSFRTYIAERFFDGIDTMDGYAEIFTNPEASEFMSASKRGRHAGSPDRVITVRGIVTKDIVYIWNMEFAEHSDVVNYLYKEHRISRSTIWPVYIDVLLRKKHVGIRMSEWSANGGQTNQTLRPVVEAHPYFKKFEKIHYGPLPLFGLDPLDEKLQTGFENSLGYCEVFLNPTNRELMDVLEQNECAALINETDIYVWNRDTALHRRVMDELYREFKVSARQLLPVYLTFRGKMVMVSPSQTVRTTQWATADEEKVQDFLRNHSFFKPYTDLRVDMRMTA